MRYENVNEAISPLAPGVGETIIFASLRAPLFPSYAAHVRRASRIAKINCHFVAVPFDFPRESAVRDRFSLLRGEAGGRGSVTAKNCPYFNTGITKVANKMMNL